MEGRYVPSLLAAIGGIIEQHMTNIGFLPRAGEAGEEMPQKTATAAPGGRGGVKTCSRCGSLALQYIEGCLRCRDCGYSKCS